MQASHSAANASDRPRMLRARLDYLFTNLPITTWINPSWGALSVLLFVGLVPQFGVVTAWRCIAAIGLHVVNSVIAAQLTADYRHPARANDKIWLRRILAFQALVGATWGLFAWFLWVDGNAINNLLVVLIIALVLWVYAYGRAMHPGVLIAGSTPTAVLAIGSILFHGGALAWPLTVIVGVTYFYAIAFAHIIGLRFDALLRTKFANEDLANELRTARDEALKKRFEAETANAAKTTFLANMSHELRTPLNAILGFSDIIATEMLGPVGSARYREYAGDIHTSGTHLLSIINDVLDVAKIEAGRMQLEPQRLDPRKVIEQSLVVIISRAREKSQTLSVGLEDNACIMADERALKQIVINLMSNAVKFTPLGGSIAISGKRMDGGGYRICIKDNGPGIRADLLDTVFVPFNQIENRYSRQSGGTGLGLSLVRGLANLHGGRAWIESEEGAGVCAYVEFPASPPGFTVPAEHSKTPHFRAVA